MMIKKDTAVPVGSMLQLNRVDPLGFCGRDNHPKKSDEGKAWIVVREISCGPDSEIRCFTCINSDSREPLQIRELMSHEAELYPPEGFDEPSSLRADIALAELMLSSGFLSWEDAEEVKTEIAEFTPRGEYRYTVDGHLVCTIKSKLTEFTRGRVSMSISLTVPNAPAVIDDYSDALNREMCASRVKNVFKWSPIKALCASTWLCDTDSVHCLVDAVLTRAGDLSSGPKCIKIPRGVPVGNHVSLREARSDLARLAVYPDGTAVASLLGLEKITQ